MKRLLVLAGLLLLLVIPGVSWARGGGGCFLPESPILRADGTEVLISAVKPGDTLWAFKPDGHLVTTHVRSVLRLEAEAYIRMKTDRVTLRVTAEHPFYVGRGTFKTAEALKPGDIVLAYDGQWLAEQRILSLERVRERVSVYNLQTDQPHTFFASGVAVHNKGGGCFPAGTGIATLNGTRSIEELASGDEVLSIGPDGRSVPTRVKTIFVSKSALLKVKTNRGALRTTRDHPIGLGAGRFRPAGELRSGDRVTRWAGGRLIEVKVRRVGAFAGEGLVFNLEVEGPHTFIAEGMVVHNKGGGSSRSSGSRSSPGGGGGGDGSWWEFFIFLIFFSIFFGFIVFILIVAASKRSKKKSENLDFVYPRQQITPKAEKTEKLLAFLSRQDPAVAPEALRKLSKATFLKLQECWGKREYGPLGPLLLPDLFTQHTAQLQGFARNHEINRIDDLQVERIDLVNVRYTEKADQREFTALFTASARDYYLDDRSGKFLRGDQTSARFQEFWTFQLIQGRWLLREIEQSGEADLLKDENFAEMLTDDTLQGIYGEAAVPKGEAGPWLEKEVEQKASRTERLLNFLARTDKLWNRTFMLERARRVFLDVYLAREAGDPARIATADLFPPVAADLKTQVNYWRDEGVLVEYRNLAVRKAELLLVRNFADNTRDEFTVWISAHAQRIIRKGAQVMSEQEAVTPFEEYWTFGRLDGLWKLKEVLTPGEGKKRTTAENLDEDSSPEQVQWYYRQPRAT
jgi:predicted lipid-binding transport protein (Tim44 family)